MVERLLNGGILLCACCAGLIGCQPQIGSARIELVGVLSESDASGRYGFGSFDKTWINGQRIRIPIPVGAEIKTEDHAVVEIYQEIRKNDGSTDIYDYRVLLAAGDDTDGLKKARGHVTNSAPTFNLSQGWAFIWGRMPLVTTGWVSAGASGSTLAVQIDGAKNIHRVFYLRETELSNYMWVQIPPGTVKPHVYDICNYVEVKPGSLPKTEPVRNAPDDVQHTIEQLKKLAKKAGWNEEGSINCLSHSCP